MNIGEPIAPRGFLHPLALMGFMVREEHDEVGSEESGGTTHFGCYLLLRTIGKHFEIIGVEFARLKFVDEYDGLTLIIAQPSAGLIGGFTTTTEDGIAEVLKDDVPYV